MKRITTFFLLLCMLLPTMKIYSQNSEKLTVRQIGTEENNNQTVDEEYKNFRLTLGGGYAYRLGKELKSGDRKLDDFTSGLRSGYNLDIEAQYFFNEHIGIGLNGNYVSQSNSDTHINIPNAGYVQYYTETNKTLYTGASCVMRVENEKWGFYASIGLGPTFYTTIAEIIPGRKASLSKTTLSSYYSISGEHRLNRNIGLGVKLSSTNGSIKIDGVKERLSVSNLMIGGFLSFRSR